MIDPLSYLERPCDILIPAANEKSINASNAEKIKCKVLIEGANGPTTFQAEEILMRNKVMIVPDILINTGGVIVSYFEWLKNIEHVSPGKLTKRFEEKTKLRLLKSIGVQIKETSPFYKNLEGAKEIDLVCTGLEEFMTSAVRKHWEYKINNNVTLRDACYITAIKDIHQNYIDRGIMG